MMRRGRQSWIGLLFAAGLSFTAPRTAYAGEGDGVGGGPVFVLPFSGGFAAGWEVSGGLGLPLLKISVGGEYRVVGEKSAPAFHHYVAYEPWLLVGGTYGFAVSDEAKALPMYGLWEALPLDPDDVFRSNEAQWMGTVALGWRAFGKQHSVYLTPKLWWFHGFNL